MCHNKICYVVMNDYNYQTSDSVGTVAIAASADKQTAVIFMEKEIAATLHNLYVEEKYDKSFCEEYRYNEEKFEVYSEKYGFSDYYYIKEIPFMEVIADA